MAKLTVGGKLPEFTYDTPFSAGASITETVRRVRGKTALVFLRYYGCTLCQYDIHQFQTQYGKIAATGGQLLVVLQSAPKNLAEQLGSREALPFDIICDPREELYKRFEILPAEKMEDALKPGTMAKIDIVKASGLQHGEYEGNEQQLPAAFVVTPDLTLTYAHYAQELGDVPTPDELARLLG